MRLTSSSAVYHNQLSTHYDRSQRARARAAQAELGELREYPDVEEGSAVAAPGKGKAELRVLPFLGHWRPVHDLTGGAASQRLRIDPPGS